MRPPLHILRLHGKRFVVALFCLCLVLPAAGFFAPTDRDTPRIKTHGWKRFWPSLRDFSEKRFALRAQLESSWAWLHVWLLRDSPRDTVRLGREDWLFYTDEPSRRSLRRAPLFSGAELDEWVEGLTAQQRWLAQRGSHLIVVLAPDKHSVHPEKLYITPEAVRPSRIDQLQAQLADHPDIIVVNTRDVLLRQAQAQQLFFKSDTHWNDFGGFLAYRAVSLRLQQVFPQLQPLNFADVLVTPGFYEGDLGRFVGRQDLFREDTQQLEPRAGRRSVMTSKTVTVPYTVERGPSGLCSRNPQGEVPRLLLFHDSFANAMVNPWLAEHFQEVLAFTQFGVDEKIMRIYPADVVMVEILERNLYANAPPPFAWVPARQRGGVSLRVSHETSSIERVLSHVATRLPS